MLMTIMRPLLHRVSGPHRDAIAGDRQLPGPVRPFLNTEQVGRPRRGRNKFVRTLIIEVFNMKFPRYEGHRWLRLSW
jgi:hypothetical protein